MSKNIPLHKEHGLNPTLCTCLYCGEETGEIALLGANYEGEAPRHMCTSLEPCEKCKEKYKDYVLLLEANNSNRTAWDNRGSSDKPQPTGRWLAIKKEYITDPNVKHIAFMTSYEFNQLLKQAKEE